MLIHYFFSNNRMSLLRKTYRKIKSEEQPKLLGNALGAVFGIPNNKRSDYLETIKDLTKIINYDPCTETIVLEEVDCKGQEGIWDSLGWYDARSRRIYLCEPRIVKESRIIAKRIKEVKQSTAYFIVRELVRLHEYIHAIQHHLMDGTFNKIPSSILEPSTVFTEKLAVEECINYPGNTCPNLFMDIFEGLDEDSLQYYRRWRELEIIEKAVGKSVIIPRSVIILLTTVKAMVDNLPKTLEDYVKVFKDGWIRNYAEILHSVERSLIFTLGILRRGSPASSMSWRRLLRAG